MNRTMDARLSRIEQSQAVGAVEYHWVENDEQAHQLALQRPGVHIVAYSWARTPDEGIPDPSR